MGCYFKMADQRAWSRKRPISNKLGFPHLTYSRALDCIKDGSSCLYEIESQKQIGLSPKHIGKVDAGIREALDSDLLKYSEELNGIIVCYKQVRCLDTSGSIMDETPFIYFPVSVNYIIFRPQVGMKLQGIVNRVGRGHYGCIVHECFNASVHRIKTEEITVSKKLLKKISKIDVGTVLVFRITRFDIHNDILSIKGKIDVEDFEKIRIPAKDTSLVKDEHSKDSEEADSSKIKGKKKAEGRNSLNGSISDLETKSGMVASTKDDKAKLKVKEEKDFGGEEDLRKVKPKKNKRKHSEIIDNIKVENAENDETIHSVPKKKKKKNKSH